MISYIQKLRWKVNKKMILHNVAETCKKGIQLTGTDNNVKSVVVLNNSDIISKPFTYKEEKSMSSNTEMYSSHSLRRAVH